MLEAGGGHAEIEEQFKARKIESDILVFQTVQDFVGWKYTGPAVNAGGVQ